MLKYSVGLVILALIVACDNSTNLPQQVPIATSGYQYDAQSATITIPSATASVSLQPLLTGQVASYDETPYQSCPSAGSPPRPVPVEALDCFKANVQRAAEKGELAVNQVVSIWLEDALSGPPEQQFAVASFVREAPPNQTLKLVASDDTPPRITASIATT